MDNVFFAYGELTPLSWMLICSLVAFAVQLTFCLKARKKALKCVPLYLAGGGLLFGGATSAGLFGTSSAGAVSANGLAGLFIIAVASAASVGLLIAWLVYWIIKLSKKA